MEIIMTFLISILTKAVMAIVAKLCTEAAAEKYMRMLIIYALSKLVKMTSTKIDDEIVADIIEKLK